MLAAKLEEDANDRKDAALALIDRGFFVLPVKANEKRPDPLLAPNGFADATRDRAVVSDWFNVKPNMNVGIACGAQYGLVVLDGDVKGAINGIRTLADLGVDFCTLTADTPSRGCHGYYKHPGITLPAKLPGVDVKGADGCGYVLAPPSRLPNGVYRWRDPEAPVQVFPAELLAKLKTAPKAAPKKARPVAQLVVPEGERHTRLVELGAVLRGKGLTPDQIETLLWDEATRYFDPPFDRSNPKHRQEIENVVRWYGGKPTPESEAAELVLLTGDELAIRARERPASFIAEPVLPTAGSLMTFGPTGHGKSQLAIAFAIALARGESFLDWKVTRPSRVLFCDGEMPLSALYQRASRYLRGAALPVNLMWLCEAAQAETMPNLADDAGQAAYLSVIERTGAEVVFFDNLTALRQTTADAPENSVEAFQPVIRLFKQLSRMGVAAVLLHHAGKSGAQRGSSAHAQPFDSVLKISLTPQHDPLAEFDVALEFEKARWFTKGPPQRAEVAADDDDFEA
jgi:hypothetical protein